MTHVHSDHLVDLADVVMTRWIQGTLHPRVRSRSSRSKGVALHSRARMLEPFVDDIAVRIEHVQDTSARARHPSFRLSDASGRGLAQRGRTVSSKRSASITNPCPKPSRTDHHAAGVVVISGDTRVCDEVLDLASGADVLVHEACRAAVMALLIAGTPFERIFDYHADTVALGALADAAGVGHLVLTHLIPPPTDPAEEDASRPTSARAATPVRSPSATTCSPSSWAAAATSRTSSGAHFRVEHSHEARSARLAVRLGG